MSQTTRTPFFPSDEDRAFARFAQSGDLAALAQVFDRLAPHLMLVATQVASPGIEAEDLVQSTFLRAIEFRERYRSEHPVRHWLVGILTRVAREESRRQQRKVDPERCTFQEPVEPLRAAEIREMAQEVFDVLEDLPDAQRQALHMRLVHGLRVQQIARIQGVPVATAQSRVQRGLVALRRRLPAGLVPGVLATVGFAPDLRAMRERILASARRLVPGATSAWFAGVILLLGGLCASVVAAFAAPDIHFVLPARQTESGSRTSSRHSPDGPPGRSERSPLEVPMHPFPQPPTRPSALALLAAAGVLSVASNAQTPYYEVDSPGLPFFGEGIAILDDIDGDGCSDFIVGTRATTYHVFSGRTGREIQPVSFTEAVGACVRVGDVNGDGAADFLVKRNYTSQPGVVRVISGTAGFAEIRNHSGGIGFGDVLGVCGDIDDDGLADYAIQVTQGMSNVYSGATGAVMWTNLPGEVVGIENLDADGKRDLLVKTPFAVGAYSGGSGTLLRSWTTTDRLYACLSTGDLDGDGVTELAFGFPNVDQAGQRWVGVVRIYSGATGALLSSHWGTRAQQRFGRHLERMSDLNGDGIEEILFSDGGSEVGVFDPRTGQILARFAKTRATGYGTAVSTGGDMNGDGVQDALIGEPRAGNGKVQVYSGETLSLRVDTPILSVGLGGTQAMDLDAGASHGGELYILLGSISGTSPGVPLNGLTVPLNYDVYTWVTLVHPNSPPLTDSLGHLDVLGRFRASFSLPAGGVPTSAIGMTMEHAFLTFDASGLPSFVSNPTPLTFVQ